MSWLSDIYDEVAEVLCEYRVLTYVPEKVSAPSGFIAPGEPLIASGGETFKEKRLNLNVTVLFENKTNKVSTFDAGDALDDLINLLQDETEFWVEDASIGMFDDQATGKAYPAITINITTYVTF